MPTYRFEIVSSIKSQTFGTESVQNWNELKPSLTRNSTYIGLVPKFTNTFIFVGSVRQHLRDLLDKEGSGADASLFIYAGNDNAERNSFKQLGGEFTANFADKVTIDETTISLNFEDSSFQSKFFARQKQKIEFNIAKNADGGDMSAYELDEITLHDRTIRYQSQSNFLEYVRQVLLFINPLFIPPFETITSDPDVKSTFPRPNVTSSLSGFEPEPTELYILKSEEDKIYDINWDYTLDISRSTPFNQNAPVHFLIRKYEDDLTTYTDYLDVEIGVISNGTSGGVFSYNFSDQIELKENQSLFIGFYCLENLGAGVWTLNIDEILTSKFTSYKEQTTAQCIRPHKLGERLVEYMTGQQASFYSELLGTTDDGYASDGEWSRLIALNGKMIRQFPFDNNPFLTSFEEFFKAYNAVTPIAAWIETIGGKQRIRLEKYQDYFNKQVGFKSGRNVNEVRRESRDDVLYTEIKAGYKDIEFEEVNGLDSAFGEINLSTPLRSKDNVYDIISPWYVGGYAIEFPRRLPYSTNPTTDSKYDKFNYMIDAYVVGGKLVARKAELFQSITGILAPENIYNARLTPKRNLLRHGIVIKESLTKKNNDSLIYIKGANNQDLVTQLITETEPVVEKDDVPISDLPNPILLAELLFYNTPLFTDDFNNISEVDKNKLCNFTDISEVELYGYIDDLSHNHPGNEAEITLIRGNL